MMSFPFSHQSKDTLVHIGVIVGVGKDTKISNNTDSLLTAHIDELREALSNDAEAYLYNALVSFGAAVHSVNKKIKNYGWAIVKLYYSVFYAARAKLAINQFAIVYVETKPYLLSLSSSSPSFSRQTGKNVSTHKLVIKLSQEKFVNDTFINDTVTDTATGQDILILNWLMKRREEMNYTSSMMPDPTQPDVLRYILQNDNDIERWLNIYKDDPDHRIDQDHTCIAYPFLLLLEVLHEFKTKVHPCNQLRDNMDHLNDILKEDNKNFDVILSVIRDCIQQ